MKRWQICNSSTKRIWLTNWWIGWMKGEGRSRGVTRDSRTTVSNVRVFALEWEHSWSFPFVKFFPSCRFIVCTNIISYPVYSYVSILSPSSACVLTRAICCSSPRDPKETLTNSAVKFAKMRKKGKPNHHSNAKCGQISFVLSETSETSESAKADGAVIKIWISQIDDTQISFLDFRRCWLKHR